MPGKGYNPSKTKDSENKGSNNPRSPDYNDFWKPDSSTVDELYEKMNNMSQEEYDNKKKLQEQEVLSFLSALPGIGPFISSADKIRQMQDYYNNTGQVPTYYTNMPGGGLSSLGNAFSQLVTKIPKGQNDLYRFYAGEPDMMFG